MTSRLVEIGRAFGASDISLLRCGFEAADIPLFVHGAQTQQIRSEMALAMGGARLMVFEDDLEEAVHLLPTLLPDHTVTLSKWLRLVLLVLCFGFGATFHFMGTYARFRLVPAALQGTAPEAEAKGSE